MNGLHPPPTAPPGFAVSQSRHDSLKCRRTLLSMGKACRLMPGIFCLCLASTMSGYSVNRREYGVLISFELIQSPLYVCERLNYIESLQDSCATKCRGG